MAGLKKVVFVNVLVVLFCGNIFAETDVEKKLAELERQVKFLSEQLAEIKEQNKQEVVKQAEYEKRLVSFQEGIEGIEKQGGSVLGGLGNLHFGGYGEMHANFTEGSDSDKFDIHRLVAYIGYDFSDWIKLHSEIEVEHSFVSDDSGGEVVIEQLYVDMLLSDEFNLRLGRVLTPLGIINQNHEPTLFNGVERPSFAKYIIPSTWSSDGIGIWGNLSKDMSYQAYAVGGLDGSQFSATSGIRNGRIKERASLNDIAFTGRLDHYFMDNALRLGISGYFGGVDNGNNGSNPGVDADISIYSADFEYSVSKFDFRGAVAMTDIDGAAAIGGGVAEKIFGWYLEGGWHFWPDELKQGKLKNSDAVVFVRYDDFDTQYDMPSGVASNPAGDREEWTVGVNFYPVPNFVIKADYQVRDDETGNSLDDLFNFGIGWAF